MIGIVPSADPATANAHCSHVVATGIGSARNLAVVASGEAVIAIGGEWGTLSEIAHARQFGRPVVALGSGRSSPAMPIEGGQGIEVVSRSGGRRRARAAASRQSVRASLTGRGEVAQLVEHTTENRGVGGSIPPLAI